MILSKRKEQRRQSRARARRIEVPGYYRPHRFEELRIGHCLVWSDREDRFLPAECIIAVERPQPTALVLPDGRGMRWRVTDLSQLRFPSRPKVLPGVLIIEPIPARAG